MNLEYVFKNILSSSFKIIISVCKNRIDFELKNIINYQTILILKTRAQKLELENIISCKIDPK